MDCGGHRGAHACNGGRVACNSPAALVCCAKVTDRIYEVGIVIIISNIYSL